MEKAFSGPAVIAERMGGTLDVAAIAAADPAEFVALCSTPPAVHRFPGSMAGRVQAVARELVEHWDGRAENHVRHRGHRRGAEEADRRPARIRRAEGGIFVALLGKRFGVQPAGWAEAAGPYGVEGSYVSVADVADPESLQLVRAAKKAAKAAARAGVGRSSVEVVPADLCTPSHLHFQLSASDAATGIGRRCGWFYSVETVTTAAPAVTGNLRGSARLHDRTSGVDHRREGVLPAAVGAAAQALRPDHGDAYPVPGRGVLDDQTPWLAMTSDPAVGAAAVDRGADRQRRPGPHQKAKKVLPGHDQLRPGHRGPARRHRRPGRRRPPHADRAVGPFPAGQPAGAWVGDVGRGRPGRAPIDAAASVPARTPAARARPGRRRPARRQPARVERVPGPGRVAAVDRRRGHRPLPVRTSRSRRARRGSTSTPTTVEHRSRSSQGGQFPVVGQQQIDVGQPGKERRRPDC